MASPSFLERTPEPRTINRLYHGRKIMVWEGVVKITAVQGWVDNPRIELARKQIQARLGNRPLTQDEVLDLMKSDKEFKLAELRDDILKNGLREPIVLSFGGRLLDGNRRFFAVRHALENMDPTNPDRVDLERVHAYVLTDEATEEDERRVLVEENFAASLKLEWPDYVKARYIKKDNENGLPPDVIAGKYGWGERKVKETLRIWKIVDEFVTFVMSPPDPEDEWGGGLGLTEHDAERAAAENYQFFNEAQKSFFADLNANMNFKIQFFKWIMEGKFGSFPEVRIAYKAWKFPEARSILMNPEPGAAKAAKAFIDYNERIVQSADEASARIEIFVKFLKGLKIEEIEKISVRTLEKVRDSLRILEGTLAAATAGSPGVPPAGK